MHLQHFIQGTGEVVGIQMSTRFSGLQLVVRIEEKKCFMRNNLSVLAVTHS